MSRLLLISRSRKFENRLRALFNDDLDTIMGLSLAKGASAALSTLTTGEGPDVALLGPSLSYAQAYELSAGLSVRYPGTAIMLVRENSPGTAKWVSDMKIHAVASPSMGDSALFEAVNDLGTRVAAGPENALWPEPEPRRPLEPRAVPGLESDAETNFEPNPEPMPESATGPKLEPAAPAPSGTRGRVIAVLSPKGGMGKTTVATNLAVGLARIAPSSVVLIDADVQFGDVATALAIEPTYTLADAVSEMAAHDTMLLKTYLTAHPVGFYTVCGARSPVEGDRVSGPQLSRLIDQLADAFRYVIVDTAPGLGDHTLAAIEQANDAVLICGMSVTSARGLRKHLEVLSTIGIMPPTRHVVLNFADRVSGLTVRDVEATTGVPVDIAIPRSKLVVLSSNRGVPLLEDHDRNSASKALGQLVRRFNPSEKQRRTGHRRVVVK